MAEQGKWLGLLKWSMQYQDGTHESTAKKEMSLEDQEFLEKVMKEGIIDEVERMTHILRILSGEAPQDVFGKSAEEVQTDEDLVEYKTILLDELLTRVDQIDNAQNFVKLKGLPVLISLFTSEHKDIQCLAAQVFSTVVQNNPVCQKAALELNAFGHLLKLFLEEEPLVRVRALSGISCLVRGHVHAELDFLSENINGMNIVLLNGLKDTKNVALQRKALFLLRFLINQSVVHANLIHKSGFPYEILITFIGHEDIDLRENGIGAMVDFLAYKEVDFVKNIDAASAVQLVNAVNGRKKQSEVDEIELDLLNKLQNVLVNKQ